MRIEKLITGSGGGALFKINVISTRLFHEKRDLKYHREFSQN